MPSFAEWRLRQVSVMLLTYNRKGTQREPMHLGAQLRKQTKHVARNFLARSHMIYARKAELRSQMRLDLC